MSIKKPLDAHGTRGLYTCLKSVSEKFAAQILSTLSHVPSQSLWTAIKGEYLVKLFIHCRYYRPYVYIRQ